MQLTCYDGPEWLASAAFRINHFQTFVPCVFRGVLHDALDPRVLLDIHTHVDASCLPVPSVVHHDPSHQNDEPGTIAELKGNAAQREKVTVKISSYAEAFLCRLQSLPPAQIAVVGSPVVERQEHWLTQTGLNLYLSQTPIYENNPPANSDYIIAHVIDHIRQPDILKDSEIHQVNLWMNIDEIISSLHYDANHNILVVHRGTKEIILISPDWPAASKLVNPSYGGDTHHANVDFQDITMVCPDEYRYCIVLREGDAVFIPEGWWHAVKSSSCTIGINYWFRSPLYDLQYGQSRHMLQYLLRSSMHRLVEEQLQEVKLMPSPSWRPIDQSYEGLEQLIEQYLSSAMIDVESTKHMSKKRGRAEEGCINDNSDAIDILGMRIIRCDFATMYQLWPKYAKENPTHWAHFLMLLSPRCVTALTNYWDDLTSRGDVPATNIDSFFEKIYEPCGDMCPEIRKRFILQRDAMAKYHAITIAQEVLGL